MANDDSGGAEYVRYDDGRLSARVSGMSLHALLQEIGRQSGAAVRLRGLDDRPAYDRFDRLPLDDALRRLMPEDNFTVVYSPARTADGRIVGPQPREIQVWGPGDVTVATPAPVLARAAPEPDLGDLPAGGMMNRFSSFFQKHKSVALEPGGPAATELGSNVVPLGRLMMTGMKSDDPSVRQEAVAVVAEVFDGDPEAVELIESGPSAQKDLDAIATAVSSSGGEHADEFLEQLGRKLKTPMLRLKTNQILGRYKRLR